MEDETPGTEAPTVPNDGGGANTSLAAEILLPSDRTWRMNNYFKLVERQRALAVNPMPATWAGPPETSSETASETPWTSSKTLELDVFQNAGRGRCVRDIAKAGRLLATPPMSVTFQDEEDMRKVYSLIYDVFRYKSVMDQALVDTSFFILHPKLGKHRSQLWLLMYDMWQRNFTARDARDEETQEILEGAGLAELDITLWAMHVRLAAALARMRIKYQALRLEQLLPPHLRDEKVIALDSTFVTVWINPFRSGGEDAVSLLRQAGLEPLPVGSLRLTRDTFAPDKICPRVILCHPSRRPDLAQSELVKEHKIVMQDRAFCLGPAAMARVLRRLELRGSVAQTHINSARTTAYLAALLADNDRVDKLLAFGAGDRKNEYERYLRELGVTNAEIHAQCFVEAAATSLSTTSLLSTDSNDEGNEDDNANEEEGLLAGVAAILATPPNTYTGVTDPVDLVCSRGGDLAMLEVLTETEIGVEEKNRVTAILEEQRQTLLRAMSRPQIQIVLYETHSIVTAENSDMVSHLVKEVNQAALEKHAEEKGRLVPTGPSLTEESYNEMQVPPCDLFEVGCLTDLCAAENEQLQLDDQGCFLAILQRKEIVKLDNKYMIDIAESRGLFGSVTSAKKSAANRQRRRDLGAISAAAHRSSNTSNQVKRHSVQVDRIAAPTQASLLRSVHGCWVPSAQELGVACPRHRSHLEESKGKSSYFHRTTPKSSLLHHPKSQITSGSQILKQKNTGAKLNVTADMSQNHESKTPSDYYHPSDSTERYIKGRKMLQMNVLNILYENVKEKASTDSECREDSATDPISNTGPKQTSSKALPENVKVSSISTNETDEVIKKKVFSREFYSTAMPSSSKVVPARKISPSKLVAVDYGKEKLFEKVIVEIMPPPKYPRRVKLKTRSQKSWSFNNSSMDSILTMSRSSLKFDDNMRLLDPQLRIKRLEERFNDLLSESFHEFEFSAEKTQR